MERRGHLIRTRSESDGRSHRIALSADGLAAWRKSRERMRDAVRALNVRLGSARDRDELRLVLGALDDAVLGATQALHGRPRAVD